MLVVMSERSSDDSGPADVGVAGAQPIEDAAQVVSAREPTQHARFRLRRGIGSQRFLLCRQQSLQSVAERRDVGQTGAAMDAVAHDESAAAGTVRDANGLDAHARPKHVTQQLVERHPVSVGEIPVDVGSVQVRIRGLGLLGRGGIGMALIVDVALDQLGDREEAERSSAASHGRTAEGVESEAAQHQAASVWDQKA